MSLVGWMLCAVTAALIGLAVAGWRISAWEQRIREQEWWRKYVAERARREQG